MLRFQSEYQSRVDPSIARCEACRFTSHGRVHEGRISDQTGKHIPDILSCIPYHIALYFKLSTLIKQFSVEFYVFTPVTFVLQQRMNLKIYS
jgi:hypothetical protein